MTAAQQKPSLIDRQGLLLVVIGVCVVNGVFSPYLVIALQIAPILMPEMFPRTVNWALFFSSVVVSTATLLLSGIIPALYERIFESDMNRTTSMWIWVSLATVLTLPALDNLNRMING